MEPYDPIAADEAANCLAVLDELFQPRSPQEEGEMAELRASGVNEARIQALYPVAGEDYVQRHSFEGLSETERHALASSLGESEFRLMVRLKLKEGARSESEPILAQLADICIVLRTILLSDMIVDGPSALRLEQAADICSTLSDITLDLQEVADHRRLRIEHAAHPPSRMRRLAEFLGLRKFKAA